MSKRRSSHGFYLPEFKVLSRIFLAIIGSYGIAVLTSLTFLALPIDEISAIYWGQIASVVVCALILVLVFFFATFMAGMDAGRRYCRDIRDV